VITVLCAIVVNTAVCGALDERTLFVDCSSDGSIPLDIVSIQVGVYVCKYV
jgi:hypothetical protein